MGVHADEPFLTSATGVPPSLRVCLDRGRLIDCTEVGVPMLGASIQAIDVRHRQVLLGAIAAVVLFVLCMLGPGVPLAIVAATSIWAAVMDKRTLRIPNRLVLVCLVIIALGAAALWLIDARTTSQIALSVVAGIVIGGGPLLFLLWIVRPAAVGGGDWKLLVAQGAALGLVAPLAAGLILVVAAPVAAAQRLSQRQPRSVPLGPGLAAGFVTSAIAAFAFPELLGGTS